MAIPPIQYAPMRYDNVPTAVAAPDELFVPKLSDLIYSSKLSPPEKGVQLQSARKKTWLKVAIITAITCVVGFALSFIKTK